MIIIDRFQPFITYSGDYMIAKGSTDDQPVKNRRSKIVDNIEEIKSLYQNTTLTLKEIGARYGVSKDAISLFVKGKTYGGIGKVEHRRHIRWGERAGNVKITRAIAEEIRRLYTSKEMTQNAIAQKYGITQAAVSKIVLGKTWL